MILLKLRVERSPATMRAVPLRCEIFPLRFAAVEMTVGQVGPMSFVFFRNDCKLSSDVSSRAEVHVGMGSGVS